MTPKIASIARFASLCVFVGVGDGTALRHVMLNPHYKHKIFMALLLKGEKAPEGVGGYATINEDDDIDKWAMGMFCNWHLIPNLAGADFIDDIPLETPEQEAQRQRILPRMTKMLCERPQSIGNDINDTFMGLHHATLNAKTLLKSPLMSRMVGWYDCPAISLGAGPSVKEHLDALRSLQHKCLLIACDAVLPALLAEGIEPHYVTPLERLRQNAPFTSNVGNSRTIFAGLPVCHPATVQPFNGKTLFVAGCDALYEWFVPGEQQKVITGSSTGILSAFLSLLLTKGPVYLLGHDLAKRKDGDSHWNKCDLAVSDFKKQNNDFRPCLGNDGTMDWQSTFWWDIFKTELTLAAANYPGRLYNVNASTGLYARINGTIAGGLPDPSSLSDIQHRELPVTDANVYAAWLERARFFPADCDTIRTHCETAKKKILAMLERHPKEWDTEKVRQWFSIVDLIPPDRKIAFDYILRSLFYNDTMYSEKAMRYARDPGQAMWHTARQFLNYCDVIPDILGHIKGTMVEALK